jgi:hypothetical protein
MVDTNAAGTGVAIRELMSTHGLAPTTELEQVLNLAWDAQLHRFNQAEFDAVELSRASCLFALHSLDRDTEKLLESWGYLQSRFVEDVLLSDFTPTAATIPPDVRANAGLVDAVQRYATRFPERKTLDPIGLTYGCLATERGRFIGSIEKAGLDRLAALGELEQRLDNDPATAPVTKGQPTPDVTQQAAPDIRQQATSAEVIEDDGTDAVLNFGALLQSLSDRGYPSELAQLVDGAKLACGYANHVGMQIDTVLMFASLLVAPRRGDQLEESWFIVFNELDRQFKGSGAPPEEVVGLRQYHGGLEKVGALGDLPWSKEIPVRQEIFHSLEDANEIALRVGTQPPNPGVRHWLAALIWGPQPRVRSHLHSINVDVDRLKRAFFEWVRQASSRLGENDEKWADYLNIDSWTEPDETPVTTEGEESPLPVEETEPERGSLFLTVVNDTVGGDSIPLAQFAGFAADSAEEQDDLLGVKEDVKAICAILAARDVPLPLSLGLFGDWGSGKTFFMNMMHDRIKLLADSSRGKKPEETAYCDKVVQIRFNAWHYIDANLWASLVTYILDKLYASLSEDKTDPWKKAVADLEQAQGLHEEAKHVHQQAKVSVTEAENALQDARNERVKREKELRTQFSALTSVLADTSRTELDKIVKDLGLDESVSTVEELSKEIGELRMRGESMAGTLAAIARSKYAVPYFALLLLILLLPIGIGWLVPKLTEGTGFAAELGTVIGQIGTVVVGIAAWLKQPLNWISKGISGLADIQQKAEAKQQELLSEAKTKPEAELAVLREKETAARENMRTAEKRLHDAEVALKEAQPSRRLYRLIEERAESEDYRSRLGIISLIRNDFERLSKLIRPAKAKSNGERDAEAKSANVPKKEPIPIDRIILYIDDLDRCPADRVVQVLEAVHLLLAFPIFVVVVAVDPRWLRRSLELTHPHLLTGLAEEGKLGGNGKHSGTRAATPQNYLEKIFQVPFNLRPMGRVGYQKLIRKLVETPGAELDIVRQQEAPQVEDGETASDEATVLKRTQPKAGAKKATIKKKTAAKKKLTAEKRAAGKKKTAVVIESESKTEQAKGGESQTQVEAPDLKPPALDLSGSEKKFMEELNLLFRTPRAVKRFVNTYRIFRVRAPGSDTDVFRGTDANHGEYRCAMVLLAIITGFPSLAPKAIRILFLIPKESGWTDIVNAFRASEVREQDFLTEELVPTMREGQAEWLKMCEALERLGHDDALPFDAGTFVSWTPWVGRYAFSSVLPAYREAE